MEAHQLINQTSGEWEYFTPDYLAEAGRLTMGGIELDPASCAKANETIGALRYFTKEQDGLAQEWSAESVWMNHPFHRRELKCLTPFAVCKKKICKKRGYHIFNDIPGNQAWINKLIAGYVKGDIDQACCLTYAITSEVWFKPLKEFPICLLDGRTSYSLPDGSVADQNTKGSCVTYLGTHVDRFYDAFKPFGTIHLPYDTIGKPFLFNLFKFKTKPHENCIPQS